MSMLLNEVLISYKLVLFTSDNFNYINPFTTEACFIYMQIFII